MPTINKPSNNTDDAKAERDVVPHMRVFVGVHVAPEIARELAGHACGLKQFSVRLVAAADIHVTLVPPWNEASISETLEKLRQVTNNFGAFALTFQRICYGPQPRRPSLLWAECAATSEIVAFHAALIQAFGRNDERPFRPHATLARFPRNGSAIARRRPFDQELALSQQVDSLALFQSPPPGERGYRVLASLELGASIASAPNTQFLGSGLADRP
jgi:2'-5' RNA ligase